MLSHILIISKDGGVAAYMSILLNSCDSKKVYIQVEFSLLRFVHHWEKSGSIFIIADQGSFLQANQSQLSQPP